MICSEIATPTRQIQPYKSSYQFILFIFILSVCRHVYKDKRKEQPTRAATAALFFHEPAMSRPAAALSPEDEEEPLEEEPEVEAEPEAEPDDDLDEAEEEPEEAPAEPREATEDAPDTKELLKELSSELSEERAVEALEEPDSPAVAAPRATEPAREVIWSAWETAPEVTVSKAPTAPEVTVP